jgi:hypothetical protein
VHWRFVNGCRGVLDSCDNEPIKPIIRTNIKIRFITNNYNYLSHVPFHLLNILILTLKYIFIII